MKTLAVTCFLFFLVTLCYGQRDFRKGYVINQAKDTLDGLVDYRQGMSSYHECNFKQSENADIVVYRPDEITGYGFVRDKYFESREMQDDGKGKQVFLEVIVKGLASLYRFERIYLVEKNGQGLQVLRNEDREGYVDGRQVTRKSNEHIATLGILFFDCVELRDELRSFNLDERPLTNLVEAYNKCHNAESITFKEHKPWVKARISLAAGINTSAVKTNVSFNAPAQHTLSYEAPAFPFGGITIDVSYPRLYEPLSVHAGAFYQKASYYKYSVHASPGTTIREYITLEKQSVRFPAGARYVFPERKITTFISGGFTYTLNVAFDGSVVQEREQNNVVETFYNDELTIGGSLLGFWGGIGGIIKLPYRFDALVELRYERSNNVLLVDVAAGVTSFQLAVGIRTK